MSDKKANQASEFGSIFGNDGAKQDIQNTKINGVVVPENLDEGKKSTIGVSLPGNELTFLTELAASLGIARHALLRYAVRHFVVEYSQGKIDLQSSVKPPDNIPKNKLNLPG